MSKDQAAPHELVIVRRRSNEEEHAHHGGVWKIAYADFMTAMMAFFLVMWLVNAADKKVLRQVASYFNPLKMSDTMTSSKGVNEMSAPNAGKGDGDSSSDKDKKAGGATGKEGEEDKSGHQTPGDQGGESHYSEQELFSDPYGVLAKLSQEASSAASEKTAGAAAEGKSAPFRDPFEPSFRSIMSEGVPPELEAEDEETEAKERPVAKSASPADAAKADDKAAEAGAAPFAKSAERLLQAKNGEAVEAKPAEPASATEAEKKANEHATEVEKKIEANLGDFPPGSRPEIAVKAVSEGVLISLTDEFDFGMFRLASAEPNPRLVLVMEKVGQVLQRETGSIVIRGHTDARPFKSGASDNWRLSSQRALITRHMLIRAGVDEKRIERVEGYADRQLSVPADPMAAQNRRIEILVRAEKPS